MTNQTPAPNPTGEPRPTVPASVLVLGTVLIVLIVLACIEAASYVAMNFFIAPRDRGGFYLPPVLERGAYDSYLVSRDPMLGWPSPGAFGGATFDESGARRSPAFPQPGGECVVLAGDSFTFARRSSMTLPGAMCWPGGSAVGWGTSRLEGTERIRR